MFNFMLELIPFLGGKYRSLYIFCLLDWILISWPVDQLLPPIGAN